MKNFSIKRFTASLLFIVMVVAALPVSLFSFTISAEETVLDAAIFCSDVHGSTSDLTSVLNGVNYSGVTYSSIGFVGDTCLTVANTTSIVQSALSDTDIDVMFSYASSHDTDGGADISTNWNYSGEVKGVSNYYLVYTIRETDMQNDNGAEAAFTSWYNGLTDAQKKLPIFIMSHRPLHARRNDNAGAAAWYDAISAAAKTSDIVFFWAHNHTGETSVDTNAYYVEKNGSESISVQGGSEVVPNFTYMNAGYINANGQNPARKGIATTVKITANSLIFQDYNSSGAYTGTYAHNVTVTREFAETKSVTGIDVTGTTRYTVGGNGLDLKVTATYDDGTTADVTADATFSPAELTASGVYTVTATYGEFTDTIDVNVNLYDEVLASDGETLLIAVEAFSQGATALEIVWDDAADAVLEEKGIYTDWVVYDLAITNPAASTVYSIYLVEDMDITNLAVYHVADDGTLTLVPHTIENDCVVFTTSLTGTFAYGSVKVPEGYTLSSITLAGIPKDIFVGGSLDLLDAVITATYTKEGAEDFVRKLTVYDWDETNWSGYDVNVAGKQTAVFTFEGKTATMDVYVWGDEFTANDVTVKLDTENGSEYGVTGVIVGESTNANVADAIKYVITGTNYVAYDISLSFAEGYTGINAPKTVTLPIPEGVTNPVVYYVPENGQAVNMKATNNGNDTLTFTTNHFSTYVVGDGTTIETESSSATVDGTEDIVTVTKVAEEVTVYKLVATPVSGKQYLIVNSNTGTGYGLDGDTTGYATTVFTGGEGYYSSYDEAAQSGTAFAVGSDVYLTTDGAYLWTAGSNSFTIGYTQSSDGNFFSGGTYSYTLNPSGSGDAWTLNGSQLTINLGTSYQGILGGSSASDDFYLTNSGSTWSMATSGAATVYFYEPVTIYKVTEQETTVPGTEGGTYSVTGTDITDALALNGQTVTLNSTLTFTATSGTVTNITGWDVMYEVVTTKGNPNVISSITDNIATLSGVVGTAVVKATYTNGTHTAWSEFIVTANAIPDDQYTIDLTDGEPDFNSITAPIAIKGVQAGQTASLWAIVKAGEHDLGNLGSALTWKVSNTSVAAIDTTTGIITFTGNDGTVDVTVYYTCPGGTIIEDTVTFSVTKSEYTVPEDGTNDFPEYPNEGAIRHDKTAIAVGNFSETGITKVELSLSGVAYSTGSEIDVVLMLDMTGSMSSTAMTAAEEAAVAFVAQIVKNEDGSYNKNRIAVYAFNSGSSSPYELVALGTIDSDDELTDANTAIRTASTKQVSGGTPYDDALAKCRSVLAAAKTDGTGDDRQQFCVFMSDGGPTSYEYITNYDAVKAGTASAYTTSTASATGGSNQSDSNFATIATYTHEYYSTLMKDDGVTMFSVLTGLSKTSYPNCATILENIASSSDNAYVVENGSDTTALTNAFSDIAQKILAAATNVTVADKIGGNYTMVFDAPNATVDAADGGQEYYIEVTDYALVPVYANDGTTITDYTRGTATTLLKLYFGYNNTTGYYAATDSNGTAAATPTFDTVALGDKGTKYYWTTDSSKGDSGVSVTGSDGTTYYFVSTGDGTHNMTAGAFASGTNTTVTLTYEDGTTAESVTCQNMIIATPYFVYNASTKMLIWTMEKIVSSEITLTYFLYLNNSGGFSGTDNEIEPKTYETNQFAYVSYTNFQNKECMLTFPVPQMTWNGAQVSYVFYLVNEQGQPVNRSGKVVPLSEAVYVTKVKSYSIIWNDLEQVAGLEAERLAEKLVPDVYTLFDNGAGYLIHVYEDQDKVNLNNHFVINSSNTNGVYTTYVFNTKSDDVKYNVPGAYVKDNGVAPTYQTEQTYWCKDYDVTGTFTKTEHTDSIYGTYYTYEVTSATYTGSGNRVPADSMVSTTGGTVIGDYVYYVDDDEKIYTIVAKTDGTEVEAGFDFSNTTVAFAVVWKPELKEDIVVIDYGLDVVIDVLTNDTLSSEVVGVRDTAPTNVKINKQAYTADKAREVKLYITVDNTKYIIGTASVENLKSVKFTFANTTNTEEDDIPYGMQLSSPIVFYYESDAKFYDDGVLTSTSLYSSVTIIPATTIYYEESFVNFYNAGATTPSTPASGTVANGSWQIVGTTIGGTQDQDRPGDYSLLGDEIDHNNVYGYDGIYASSTTYSLGSAAKTTVDSTHNKLASAPHAVFTFTGTGFDLISLTDNTSGAIALRVLDKNGTELKDYRTYINNYYGCKYENGEWIVDESSTDCIYQVPVVKISGLTHGTYTVELYVQYATAYDLTGDGQYTFVLDSIRIYDPAEDCNDTYVVDEEGYPHYLMVKEAILGRDDLENLSTDITGTLNGSVFIDGKDSTSNAADYSNPGPNHEAYLAPGQSISFKLTANTTPADVQLGAKLAYGDSVDVMITVGNDSNANSQTLTIKTATDLYYSIMDCLGDGWTTTDTITIANVSATDSNNLLSLTNIKATFESATTVSGSEGIKTTSATASTGVYSLMSARMVNLETVAEEEPVSISFLVDAEVIEDACAVMTALYAPEPEIFVPEALEYTVTNRFFGNSTVNVITSKDVASLTVNGVEAKKLSNSPLFSMLLRLIDGFEGRFGTNISANDYVVWSASVKRAANYDIIAYNADGLSSDPTVTDSSSSITKEDIDNYFNRSEIYSIMEQMASRRFDPEQFEAYVNERFDGFREIITQTSEDVEYVIINGKIVDRYITETVIDTETGETTTKRVWITDAEDDVDDEDVEVNAYDEKGVGSESKKAERKFGRKKNSNSNNNNGNSNSASDKNNKNNKENNGKGNSGKYGRM